MKKVNHQMWFDGKKESFNTEFNRIIIPTKLTLDIFPIVSLIC